MYESLRHQEKPSLAKLSTFDLEKEADRALWEHSHYAGLVVDDDLQILHFRGDTSPYLRPVPGKATFNLLRMLREELVFELRKTINTTRETRSTVRKNGIRMKRNGDIHSINIEVRPLPTRRSSDHYFLILFEDAAGRGPREPQAEEAASAEPVVERKKKINKEVIELKSELARTRDYLQAVIQEQETTNEELKVANEEAQSSMEELQSTNEELETAKEELQSSNEELVTLNEQLQKRNNELGRLSDDLSNVLGGVNIPILLLGADRRIRRFTPSAEKTLHLLAGDIGRPVSNLRTGINIPDLDALIETVMDSLSEARREVHADDGRWYFVRIRPFLTADRKVDGVLIAFVDIQEIKEAQERLQREQQLSAAILDAAKDLLVLVLDRDGRIVQFNHACQETTGYSFEDVRGRRFWEFLPIREEKAQVKAGFEETLKGKRTHGETHWLTKNGQPRLVAWSNVLALSASGRVDNVVRTGVDVTKREEAEERAHESDAAINALLETAPQAVLAHDQDERIVLVNAAAEAMFGYSRHEMTGQPLAMLIPERFRSRHKKHVKGFFKDPHIRPMGLGLNLFGVRKDGSEFPVEIGLSFFKTRTGVLAVSFISDTTERKRSEGMLLQYQKELQTLTGRLLEIQESGNKELARELHDDLSQKLAAVGMEVSTLVQSSVGSSDSLPARIRALSARINSLTEDVHALSRRLHPAILDELGLEAALKEECVRFSALVGVPAQCESESVPRSIPENVSQCFYRIVQEGLRNVTKHAKATRARVLLSGTVDGIALRVEDNGNGFAVDQGKGEGGLGLISMEERVRLVNGRFNIKSMPGEGTTIDVFVPLKAK